jgi:hypothetical protein
MVTINDINSDASKITKKEYKELRSALKQGKAWNYLFGSGMIFAIEPDPNGQLINKIETPSCVFHIDDIVEAPYKGPNNDWDKAERFLVCHVQNTPDTILLRIV